MTTVFKDLLAKDLKSLTKDKQLLLEKLMGLRFQHNARKLKTTSELRKVRRMCAQIETAMTQKRLIEKGQSYGG